MTGRRLYEIVTDSMFVERAYQGATSMDNYSARESGVLAGNFVDYAPAAWSYLPKYEQDAWNAAAKRVTPRRRT